MHFSTSLWLTVLSAAVARFLRASNLGPVPGVHVRVHSKLEAMSQR
jgi:hypothetical protein